MNIYILEKEISWDEVKKIASETFGNMAKGVVDIEKKIIALGGELHADSEAKLLEHGSEQKNLWGFNIYTNQDRKDMIQYTSLINIRPAHGNTSLEIKDPDLKSRIQEIVFSLIGERQ